MSKQEAIETIDPTRDVELTYIPEWQDTPFIVRGDYEAVAPLAEAVQAASSAEPRNVAPRSQKPAVEPENGSEGALPVYQPATIRTKIRDWLSDAEWRRVDRELGTNIVAERQAQRLATRILVARIAAGVEAPPTWGKHRRALHLAELALQDK